MVARAEGMDVEARGAARNHRPRKAPLGRDQILLRGDLHVSRIPLKDMDGMASGARHAAIVGEFPPDRRAVRVEDEREAEGLRRLHGTERRPLRRRGDHAVADAHDRVHDQRARHRGPMGGGRIDRGIDQRRGEEGPRRIMNEHDINALACQRLQPPEHGGLPGDSPCHGVRSFPTASAVAAA